MEIKVLKNIFGANQEKADEIRAILTNKKVLMVNLIGSPGCGKTSILEKTLDNLGKKYKIAIIEGDVATNLDAKRLQRENVPVTLINTDGACHLEALSIEKAIEGFDLENLDVIFIENVGNLVCPAEFDIGEHAKVAVCSVAEGHDKPIKYPLLFTEAKAVILNKIDLLPYTNFDKNFFSDSLMQLNAGISRIEISVTANSGLDDWYKWIENNIFIR